MPTGATVVQSVIATGCGSLNIDGSRISAGMDNLNGGAYAEVATPRAGLDMWSGDRKGDTQVFRRGKEFAGEFVKPVGGRWPANLVLMHSSGCKQDGTKRVKAITGGMTLGSTGSFKTAIYGTFAGLVQKTEYGDASGAEAVVAWVCSPDCPVAELDRMSGILVSKYGVSNDTQTKGMFGLSFDSDRTGQFVGDTGTASRYFKQIQ